MAQGASDEGSFLFDEATSSYYSQRAGEYDDWWLGTGLFAQRERPGWAEEVAELIEIVEGLPPLQILDVGCGTGFLTAHPARSPRWTAARRCSRSPPSGFAATVA